MNKSKALIATVATLALLLAGTALAQSPQSGFPPASLSPDSCNKVHWNGKMWKHHRPMIQACQEVVHVDGEPWARFSASFLRTRNDGRVVFNIRDHRGRVVDQLVYRPEQGQVAYIDGRPVPFRQLDRYDLISLYVPQSEFAVSLALEGVGRP